MVYIRKQKAKSEDVSHRSSSCPMIVYDRQHNQNAYRQVTEQLQT